MLEQVQKLILSPKEIKKFFAFIANLKIHFAAGTCSNYASNSREL
jgi:hypothetical protein